MGNAEGQKRDFARWPKYKEQYIRCFDKMIETRKKRGIKWKLDWQTGQDVFDWWIGCGERFKKPKCMVPMFEEEAET